jgi:hypothetical protein
MSGYTAKVAGTEVGVKEPSATFSPCFGGPFLVWHPSKYAELLAAKMKQHNARVWLVNTGWSGGGYGVGKRIKLAHTRAILDAIHGGGLAGVKTRRDPVFGFEVPTTCPGVPFRNPVAARHLGGQGGLRRGGPEAGRTVHRQLQEVRERCQRRSAGGRAVRVKNDPGWGRVTGGWLPEPLPSRCQ